MRYPTVTIDGDEAWRLRSAEVVESLCSPGMIVAEVEHDDATIKASDMVGCWIALRIPTQLQSEPERWCSGVITHWEVLDGEVHDMPKSMHRIHAAAPLALMSLRRHTRAFTNQSVLQICEAVFGDWGERVAITLGGPMLVLDHEPCTIPLQHACQHIETDMEFVTRLLHQAGLFSVQTCHGPQRNQTSLHLNTFSCGARQWAKGIHLHYAPLSTESDLDHRVVQWSQVARLTPSLPVVATRTPGVNDDTALSNQHAVLASPADHHFVGWEYIDHPLGEAADENSQQELRERLSRVRELALQQEQHWRYGQATTAAIVPGHTITLDHLPHGDTGPFFVTATRLLMVGEDFADELIVDQPMLCAFNALPRDVQFRPPIRPERLEPPSLDRSSLARAIDAHPSLESA